MKAFCTVIGSLCYLGLFQLQVMETQLRLAKKVINRVMKLDRMLGIS